MASTYQLVRKSCPDRWRSRPARVLARLPWMALLSAALFAVVGCDKKNPTVPIPIPPLDSIRALPDTLEIRVGQNGAFSVIGWDTTGVVVNGVPAVFTSEDSLAEFFTLDSRGRVHGESEGTARVFAAYDSLRDTAVVVVLPQQDGWFAQTSNAAGVALHGVFFLPDGRRGWAVGDLGKILATTDGGAHWTPQASLQSVSLRGVWFTSALRGWVVGANGRVLTTDDGGETWTTQTSNASGLLEDVCFANDSTGWAVGASGTALRTTNRGVTWTRRIVPTSFDLNSVSFAGPLDGWAVGNGGVIAGSHDGGLTWFLAQPAITTNNLLAVWRRSEATAFAVGVQGVAPRTIRPDTTRWELRVSGATNQLEGVHFPSDLTGYAVGLRDVGLVLRTDDAGLTWRTQVSNTQFRLHDVFFVDGERGWAVGANGTILHTSTGGE